MSTDGVVLLLDAPDGNTYGVKFATREKARDFEDHHGLCSTGVVDVITQGEAVLKGMLAQPPSVKTIPTDAGRHL